MRLIVELVPSGKKKFVKTDATSLEQLVVAVEKKLQIRCPSLRVGGVVLEDDGDVADLRKDDVVYVYDQTEDVHVQTADVRVQTSRPRKFTSRVRVRSSRRGIWMDDLISLSKKMEEVFRPARETEDDRREGAAARRFPA